MLCLSAKRLIAAGANVMLGEVFILCFAIAALSSSCRIGVYSHIVFQFSACQSTVVFDYSAFILVPYQGITDFIRIYQM